MEGKNKPKNNLSLGSVLGTIRKRLTGTELPEEMQQGEKKIETIAPIKEIKEGAISNTMQTSANSAAIAPGVNINISAEGAIVKKEKKWIKVGVELTPEMIKKIDAYSYWERKKKKDVLNEALELFFKDKEVKLKP